MKQRETLIFIHIPKTAGATFSAILARLYPKQTYSIYGTNDMAQFLQLPEEQRAQIALLQGHFAYGIHHSIPRPSQYITFLRNPVERVLSFYYYILRYSDIYLYDAVANGKMSLAEFVNSSLSPELSNLQVRLVAGYDEKIDTAGEGINEATLELAKQRLTNDFTAFGITERFDESLALFAKTLHWSLTPDKLSSRTVNEDPKRGQRTEVTPQVLEDIRRHNDLDIRLYEYASRLFDERIRNSPHFGATFAIVRLFTSIKNHHLVRMIRQRQK